jgi:large subunit ribosomal protein L6
MSRIGRLPIQVPAGVTVTVGDNNMVTVKGPKGTLTQQVNSNITVKQEGNVLTLSRPNDEKQNKAFHGLYRALLHNMVVGVTEGFSKTLEMVGTGYKAKAEGNGKSIEINIGFSHPVHLDAPEGLAFKTPNDTTIVVEGMSKQAVGNMAADIRAIRKPEPYLGKGIKYQGEHIRRKEGKTGKK